MRRLIFSSALLVVAIASLLFTGCSSAPKKEDEGEKVSTLPWNKPEKWEKSGNMGGASY